MQDLKLVAFTGSYDDLSGKPQTMTPSAHTHTKNQISDFPSTMTPSAHKHGKSDITDFPSAMPPTAHKHGKSDITDFPSAMTPTAHKHTKSDITDFPQSMPASDVYGWAKASGKPSYNWNEIGNKPSVPAAVAVKGNKETSYRTGNVNLTPANIGAVNKDGDTITGTLVIGHIKGSENNRMYVDNGIEAGQLSVMPVNGDNFSSYIGVRLGITNNLPGYVCLKINQLSNTIDVVPTTSGCGGLGTNEFKFGQVYANNIYNSGGIITSSDKNKKKDFEKITTDFSEKIINGLIPTSFLYKDGTSGRRHYGLIAQDVEKLLEEIGISAGDFAPLVKSWPQKTIMHKSADENGNEIEIGELVTDYDAKPEYHLRYEGFTGLIIKYIQSLNEKISKLEKRLSVMEERIADLEKIINQGA